MRAPKGMLDVLPPESARWIDVVVRFAERARRFGFGLVVTPIVEHFEVFAACRRNDRRRAQGDVRLRRQGWPPARVAARRHRAVSCARSCSTARSCRGRCGTSHRTSATSDRRSGRYRQHWQLGVEVLGVDDPDVDVEVIALVHGFYRELGLRDVTTARQLDGRQRDRVLATAKCCSRTGASTRRCSVTRWNAPRRIRCASSTRSAPTGSDMIERAPQTRRVPDRRVGGALRARAGGSARARASRSRSHPVSCAGSTTTRAPCSSSQSGALDAAQNAIGGGGRYDRLGGGDGRPADARRSASASGIERVLLACDAEGVLAARRRAGRRVRDRRDRW